MEFTFNELRQMDVVSVSDGKNLGRVCDIAFEFPEGKLRGLFVIVQIIRVIIVKIIKGIVEINMLGFKIINRILGMAFMFAVALAILLVVFQIVAWVGGDTAANFAAKLDGSVFRLDALFENTPLRSVFGG